MREVIVNGPTAGNKARAGLSNEESVRFFGPPPLIAGEDQAQYEAIRDRVSAAVEPRDFLEEIWVNNIVNHVWETQRLRRLKAALLQRAVPQYFFTIWTHLADHHRTLERNWASREPDAVAKVDDVLAAIGLTRDELMAETLAWKLDEVERIDCMIAGAEARRNVAQRERDRHRALEAALRQTVDEVFDAEFKQIPPGLAEGEARDERP